MNVPVPVICSLLHSKMAFTSFEGHFQASYVFPLDPNNLMIIIIMFMTMIMMVMLQVGTKPYRLTYK